MERLHLFTQVWAFLIALSVGSFMNVCIARMPEDRSVVSPPSHCPSCGGGIAWYDNLPVLSWVLLRARCRTCGTRISPLYPTIELLVGVLGLLLFRHFIPTPEALSTGAMAAWGLYLAFVAALVGTTYIDLRHYIIPDEFSIYAVPVGVAGAWGLRALGWDGGPTWQQSVLGALIGGAVPIALLWLYQRVRKVEGLGFGDVKLLAMLGSFLGAWPALFVVGLLASLVGSAVGIAVMIRQGRGWQTQVPFGPFLALGGLAQLFFGEALLRHLLPGLALMAGR